MRVPWMQIALKLRGLEALAMAGDGRLADYAAEVEALRDLCSDVLVCLAAARAEAEDQAGRQTA